MTPSEEQTIAEQIGAYARSKLSEEDMRILRLLARGTRTTDICPILHLSRNAVYTRIARLFRVLGVNERAHAVAIAYATGILKGMP